MTPDSFASSFQVLVVDDDTSARELLVEFFTARGFVVAGAKDGRAAVSTLHRSNASFGLVVTDLNLPGADGFAVLQAARQANPSSYVVIVTGYASLDSAIRAVRAGAYDYLTKPFSLSQLEVILERIHDRISLERANRRLQPSRTGADYAERAGGGTLDQRLTAIERSLARIERALDGQDLGSARGPES